VKALDISGNMYSFIGDLLRNEIEDTKREDFEKAMYSLGIQAQITDDLRDLKKDVETGNNNIVGALIKKETNPQKKLEEWYVAGRNQMFERLDGIHVNEELIDLICWYPCFVKEWLN